MKPKNSASSLERPRRRTAIGPEATLARHQAQCRICRHPQREQIEGDFLDWVPAKEIAEEYKLGSWRAIYRHAHALELFPMRRGHVERVLDGILERAGEARITAGAVVAAVGMLVELSWGEKKIHLEVLRDGVGRSPAVLRSLAAPPGQPRGKQDGKQEEPAAASACSAGVAQQDEDPGGGVKLSGYPGKILRELQLAHGLARARESDERRPSPSPQAAGTASHPGAPGTATPKIQQKEANPPPAASPRTTSSKPAAPVSPSAAAPQGPAVSKPLTVAATPEPGTRREPDGPPLVAGMTWSWAEGSNPFARRNRWRRRPVVTWECDG